jgi:hypothetical protein
VQGISFSDKIDVVATVGIRRTARTLFCRNRLVFEGRNAMKSLYLFTVAVAAFIVTSTCGPGAAQSVPQTMTNGGAVITGSMLFTISRCDPQSGAAMAAPMYSGFTPGFYPGGAYYWNDAYGVRYQQAALAGAKGALYLDYTNISPKVMKTIEFGLIANGRLVAEVRDVGTFSPHAEIKHSFGLSPNVFPLQTGLPRCLPLRIAYADGTHWVSPRLPAMQHKIYGATQ